MSKARWIWAATASVAVPAALGAGLWLGGGPGTRDGWEAASWAAGITAALALIVTAVAWAATSKSSPAALSPTPESEGNTVNTVNGNVSGATLIQGRDTYMENTTYGGDHLDFRNGTFHGSIVGKQVNRFRSGPGNGRQGSDR
ncbi:hypothetical protein [Nocardiopsis deserti]|uniref:hypothetical protein n=1 Tax=Nocardiopsis deserti TaxID=2605988 RepID=UPI00123A1386|nr:hypothetical protein [Nocardiopsis deserti]